MHMGNLESPITEQCVPFKNMIKQAVDAAPHAAGYGQVAGVVLTLAPIVHRITSMLRELEPQIRDWIEAETDLAKEQLELVRTERDVLIEMADELRHNQDTLVEAVRRINEKLAEPPSNHDERRAEDDHAPGGDVGETDQREGEPPQTGG